MMSEEFAAALMAKCIQKGVAAEVLECLFNGGSFTYDPIADRIVMVTAEQISQLAGGDDD